MTRAPDRTMRGRLGEGGARGAGRRIGRLVALATVGLVVVSCGEDGAGTTNSASPSTAVATTGATTTVATTIPAATTTQPATTQPATTQPATTTSVPAVTVTTSPAATTTSTPAELEQPAIWPAADVVFATAEAAAENFVAEVLGVPPTLGEFVQGDARSGEIEVFSPGEGGVAVPRGLLLLRQLGEEQGWFILAAVSENASISAPAQGATVTAGPLTVEGRARGHEANVIVSAFVAGDATTELDEQFTMAGARETPEPFSVSLDLSRAAAGDTIVVLVRGGVGLETDPGDFSAIAVRIEGLPFGA